MNALNDTLSHELIWRLKPVILLPAISATLVIALAGAISFAQPSTPTPDSEQEPLPATETMLDEPPSQPSPEPIELDPREEKVFQELNLTNPEVIRLVRTLLQPQIRLTADETGECVPPLCFEYGEEGQRAAAALLNAPYSYVKERVISALPRDQATAELLLQSAITSWDRIPAKAKKRLGSAMAILYQSNPNDAPESPLIEDILVLMIRHKGRMVPLKGFELARSMAPESERIRQAAESQRENPEYDYFSNEHPVRRAALEFLGETYEPPAREDVDPTGISIVEQQGLTPSPGLTIGNLTSLYTATGPCAGGGDRYGWNFQFRGMMSEPKGWKRMKLTYIVSILAVAASLTGCTPERTVLCIAPSGDFVPQSGAELLQEFNRQMPFTTGPRQFLCKSKSGKLIGWVVVKTKEQKDTAKQTLHDSPRLDCLQVEALTPETAKEIKASWRQSQAETVPSADVAGKDKGSI